MNMRGFENLGALDKETSSMDHRMLDNCVHYSLTVISGFLSSVNYNITAPSGPSNTESQNHRTT